jgi:hypothetical protein
MRSGMLHDGLAVSTDSGDLTDELARRLDGASANTGVPPCVIAFDLHFDFITYPKIPSLAEVNNAHDLKVGRTVVLVIRFMAFRARDNGFMKMAVRVSY